MIPDKITFRLGALAEPLTQRCEQDDAKPSQVIRDALASYLGVDSPDMPQGFAADGERARKAQKKAVRARKANG